MVIGSIPFSGSITGVVIMKIDKVDIDTILQSEKRGIYGRERDEEKGFFKKLFGKKDEADASSYFQDRIVEIGRDELVEELSGEIDAYWIDKSDPKTTVILTESYFILPGKEIFPLVDIVQFAIGSTWLPPYAQYALDRLGVPYDPDYKSEYEEEEGFELDRFNIDFVISDEDNAYYTYTFPMDIEDRSDFRQKLIEKSEAEDLSEDEVFEGKFNEEHNVRELFWRGV